MTLNVVDAPSRSKRRTRGRTVWAALPQMLASLKPGKAIEIPRSYTKSKPQPVAAIHSAIKYAGYPAGVFGVCSDKTGTYYIVRKNGGAA